MPRHAFAASLLLIALLGVFSIPPPVAASSAAEKVSFNTQSLKYHCPQCQSAVRCTKNCITTTRAEAEKRGGVPCKVCGGTCG